MRTARIALLLAATLIAASLPAQAATGPQPGTPEYVDRDDQNMNDGYGRIYGPGGQLQNPNYLPALFAEGNEVGLSQLGRTLAVPYRLAISPGNVFPGWNVGNPLRRGWAGSHGQIVPVSWTNRYGALIRGDVFAPLPGARDPYTGTVLRPPYPGVVITTGSLQGSERMYWWLAEDLAERGYVVLTYDVQGQGTSETMPHLGDQVNALPFCNPFAEPQKNEDFACPGVPFQQSSNFVYGTQDALSFFLSTPDRRYPNPAGSDTSVNSFNPLWRLFDRSPDRRTVTPGRTTRVAIIGHSLGAFAVSYVQGVDRRVEAVVALDKLQGSNQMFGDEQVKPVVPGLGVQSEYGFNVQPYWFGRGSSFAPSPGSPSEAPDPRREEETGFDLWRKDGVDTMVIVPRGSTHLEYSDIPLALPASRYGQDLTSVYVQAWLDRYMKHRAGLHPLLASSFRYREPVAVGRWEWVRLDTAKLRSFYFCSGFSVRNRRTLRVVANLDLARLGGC